MSRCDIEAQLGYVVVTGSDEPRAYSAPGFFELAAGAEFYPLAPLKASPVVSGLGVFLTFRHHVLLLETSGPTDLGETIVLDSVAVDRATVVGVSVRQGGWLD